jgi:hypothetical protein
LLLLVVAAHQEIEAVAAVVVDIELGQAFL